MQLDLVTTEPFTNAVASIDVLNRILFVALGCAAKVGILDGVDGMGNRGKQQRAVLVR